MPEEDPTYEQNAEIRRLNAELAAATRREMARRQAKAETVDATRVTEVVKDLGPIATKSALDMLPDTDFAV